MKTVVGYDGSIADGELKGNLYLRGRGNAFLSAVDLGNAAIKLSKQGVKTVAGSIVADNSLFDAHGLERNRKGPGYAPPGALGLDLHTVAISVSPTDVGKPPNVTVEPPNDDVRVAMSALTIGTAVTTLQVIQIDDTSYRVTGNIPANSGTLKWRFALSDPALFAGAVFKTLLMQEGIRTTADVKKGKAPADIKKLVEVPGPPLSQVLRDMNCHSLNVVADNLFILLGGERYGMPGTREKGVKAVNEFLFSLGLTDRDGIIADGSGLSDGNRVTSRFMAGYLAGITAKKWFPVFYESLPRAGREGTAKNIGFISDRFRIKTGMLENVFALAGYGTDAAGRNMAFAYIVNAPGAGMAGLERSGAEVMRYLSSEVLQ